MDLKTGAEATAFNRCRDVHSTSAPLFVITRSDARTKTRKSNLRNRLVLILRANNVEKSINELGNAVNTSNHDHNRSSDKCSPGAEIHSIQIDPSIAKQEE